MAEIDDRWSEIEPLVDRALDLSAELREELIRETSASDPALAGLLRALLQAGEAPGPIGADPRLAMPGLILDLMEGSGGLSGQRCGPFRLLERIGEGGMGEVFLAERADGQFRQVAAVKLLHRLSPRVRERFERERQILADLRHEHIARLLDGGISEDGRPYIALEYIAGSPLVEYCEKRKLGREERLRIFLQACDAVQHAHRMGVVHRDLKPSNLMVGEEAGRGACVYVLDFGIARLASESDLTISGEVIGTPGYMSPEQVRGEVEAVDRRSDVFSLGVVLYEILCGRRPFLGENSASVFQAVLAGSAPAPRSLVSDLSHDLETIIRTCLESERSRRYDSVKALADDLERYLAGEPIAARPPGLPRRLARAARRRPLAAATLAVVLVSGGVTGWSTMRARHLLAERTEVAGRIGREVEQVSSFMRFAHLSELHDTAPEKQRLEERMGALERGLAGLEPPVEAAARAALGEGYLQLGDLDRAVQELERSWGLGLEAPETAIALVEAHAKLYLQERRAAGRLSDETLRVRRLAEAEQAHKLPALRFAQRVEGALLRASETLTSALVASLEGDFDGAARQATAAAALSPWLYEGHLIAGDALSTAAEERRLDDDTAAALRLYSEARGRYERAASIGRSDPAPSLRLADLEHRVAELLFFSTGGDLADVIGAGIDAVRVAAVADTHIAAPFVVEASLHTLAGRDQEKRGLDPSPTYDRAIAVAERAVELEPANAEAYWRLGDAWDFRGGFERETSRDATASLARAVEALQTAAELAPDEPGIVNSLGLTFWERFSLLEESDPAASEAADAEIAAFERAVGLASDFARGWSNLGTAQNHRAQAAMAMRESPLPYFERSVASLRRAISLDPSFAFAYNNLGNVYLNRGVFLRRQGKDPLADLRDAAEQFEMAAQRNPSWAFPAFNLANTKREVALALESAGVDPSHVIREGIEACRHGFELRPGFQPARDLCDQLAGL